MGRMITGDAYVRRGLLTKARFFPSAVAEALKAEAEAILVKAQTSHVPVDTGKLRDSGVVGEPEITFREISVSISFGGPGIAYAQAVHEHLSQHSPPSWVAAEAAGNGVTFNPSGRGPKYLETPLKAAAGGMNGRLSARLSTTDIV